MRIHRRKWGGYGGAELEPNRAGLEPRTSRHLLRADHERNRSSRRARRDTLAGVTGRVDGNDHDPRSSTRPNEIGGDTDRFDAAVRTAADGERWAGQPERDRALACGGVRCGVRESAWLGAGRARRPDAFEEPRVGLDGREPMSDDDPCSP
jgi:hypothetical protein